MKTLTIQSPRRGQTYAAWQQEWADTLIGREHFKAASASGSGYTHRTDQLPSAWLADYRATADHPLSFVVISWETPVAWVDADGQWVIPAVKYSVSTTRTQRRIMATLDSMGRGYRFDPRPVDQPAT